ncbi:MAG: sulfite exporter TauE/SafE family protein [Gammaproteobacteria bacterium]|nr:sulfite exporter TauE/SafE family protein [Gammaproteobacteria bacterium]
MEVGMFPTLLSLGLIGGFMSGLLGIGGGIIMVPLLLYVPAMVGVGTLSMKTVAGITSMQSFFGAVSGAIGHKRYNRISMPLAMGVGGSTTIGALLGSIISAYLSSEIILMVFASMAIVAAIMMLIPNRETGSEIQIENLQFNKPLAVTVGAVVGLLSGIIGQGGAFLFVPAMLYILHIPTRITIGTTLAVGIVSSAAVLIGRAGTHQIPYLMSAVLVTGVLIGAQLGSILSQKTPQRLLRGVLSVLIAATAIKIWYELLLS